MADANVLTVGSTGDYSTIAEAVTAATDGDTVQLVDDIVEREFTISKAFIYSNPEVAEYISQHRSEKEYNLRRFTEMDAATERIEHLYRTR